MGKLAERYQDAAKSGVYRVESAVIPLRAAAEAHARAWEIHAGDAHALEILGARIAAGGAGPHVVLVAAAPELPAVRYTAMVEALGALARTCAAGGVPLFAVLVDPGAALPLPLLYKERVSAPSAR